MEIDRRRFLALALALGVAPSAVHAMQANPAAAYYLSARKRDGRDEVAVLDEHGQDHLAWPMPARGHSFAIDPAGKRAVVFGRQPGFFALAIDLDGRAAPVEIPVAADRHFFGHGVYVDNGRLMVATENNYEAGRGVLGVYDASTGGAYQRIGEFDSAGIGPHEVLLMPDGKTLCVANGGILTHPDYGKLELNADTMRPSLAYINVADGKLIERVELEPALHRLSIRHLVLAADGAVWFGCQYMGPTGDRPPLVGRHRRGARLELFSGPPETLRGMRNYVGSVAVDASGLIVATSSPVGAQVAYWDTASGKCLGVTSLADACGVAPAREQGFLITSGLGAMVSSHSPTAGRAVLAPSNTVSWDNHFRRIPFAARI